MGDSSLKSVTYLICGMFCFKVLTEYEVKLPKIELILTIFVTDNKLKINVHWFSFETLQYG
jgi:hypothetical protein